MSLISVYYKMKWEYDENENMIFTMRETNEKLFKDIVKQTLALCSLFPPTDYEYEFNMEEQMMIKRKL